MFLTILVHGKTLLGPEVRAGESPAPVKIKRTARGPVIEPVVELETTPLLLNWRNLLCKTQLKGLARELAAGSEVVELEENRVRLRPLTHVIAYAELVADLKKEFTRVLGHPFAVEIAETERATDAVTVSALEQNEQRKARLALIDAFKRDPFVQKCLEVFHATLDETSVRRLNSSDKEE